MISIALLNPFNIAFLVLPPFLIISRHFSKIRIPMWAIFIGYVLMGWAFINLGVLLHFEMLAKLIESTTNPPQKWIDALVNDGAGRVFALFFGWVYATIYFIVWYISIFVVTKVVCLKRLLKDRRGACA